MSSGKRPLGAAKGKQSDTEALCQPPPPPIATRNHRSGRRPLGQRGCSTAPWRSAPGESVWTKVPSARSDRLTTKHPNTRLKDVWDVWAQRGRGGGGEAISAAPPPPPSRRPAGPKGVSDGAACRAAGGTWSHAQRVSIGMCECGGGDTDAFEGQGPQRRPQKHLDGRLEEVVKAVGGRLLSVTNAIEAKTKSKKIQKKIPGKFLTVRPRGGGGDTTRREGAPEVHEGHKGDLLQRRLDHVCVVLLQEPRALDGPVRVQERAIARHHIFVPLDPMRHGPLTLRQAEVQVYAGEREGRGTTFEVPSKGGAEGLQTAKCASRAGGGGRATAPKSHDNFRCPSGSAHRRWRGWQAQLRSGHEAVFQ